MPAHEASYYTNTTTSASWSNKSDRLLEREHLSASDMIEDWGVTSREQASCEAAAVHVGEEGPSALGTLCRHLYGCGLEDLTRKQSRRTDKLIYLVARFSGR